MSWSITKPVIRGGNPIVRWHGEPLGKLTDEQFAEAVRAAEALGEDIVDEAANNGPTGDSARPLRAASIVAGVVREMERREVVGVKREPKAHHQDQPESIEETDDDARSVN
jgi:hypothetical protein